MPARDLRRRRGRLAEELAVWWLRARGWSVTRRNLRIAGVEIDALARKGRVVALVEVKARRLRPGESAPPPADLVSDGQLRRLARAAETLSRDLLEPLTVRVDLVVVLFGRRLPRLRHLEALAARSDFQP